MNRNTEHHDTEDTCGYCGEVAEGYATINGVRYCHIGYGPTCYMLQSWDNARTTENNGRMKPDTSTTDMSEDSSECPNCGAPRVLTAFGWVGSHGSPSCITFACGTLHIPGEDGIDESDGCEYAAGIKADREWWKKRWEQTANILLGIEAERDSALRSVHNGHGLADVLRAERDTAQAKIRDLQKCLGAQEEHRQKITAELSEARLAGSYDYAYVQSLIAERDKLRAALFKYANAVERDRHEPDKMMCIALSMTRTAQREALEDTE